MASSPDVRVHATPHAAAQALAREVCRLSADAIAERGRFTIALAGGSTPAALYGLLASPPLSAGTDWSRWHVFWGDERCVPPDHPDSNYGMARRALLDRVPIPPAHVHRMAGEDAPHRAADTYAAVLSEALAPDGRLDLVLLGIGGDGHTASLFPNTAALSETERPVVANWVPHLHAHRITLTLPALNRARHVAVLATGADKADAVRRSLAPHPGDATPPIALVAPEDTPVVWYLKQDAAPASLHHSGESRNPGEGRPPAVPAPTPAVRPEPVEACPELGRRGPSPTVRPEGNRRVNECPRLKGQG